MRELAAARMAAGEPAEALARDALENLRETVGDSAVQTLVAMTTLGHALIETGKAELLPCECEATLGELPLRKFYVSAGGLDQVRLPILVVWRSQGHLKEGAPHHGACRFSWRGSCFGCRVGIRRTPSQGGEFDELLGEGRC